MITWLAASALAQDPSPRSEIAPMEVVVWGELACDQARDALVAELESMGYRVARRDGDHVVLKPPAAWMGRVTVHPDGALDFGRPAIGFGTLPEETYAHDPRHGTDDPRVPTVEAGAGATFWLLPGERKRDAVQRAVLDRTHDERDALLAVTVRTAIEAWVDQLPGKLDALWTTGAPLTGSGPTLGTEVERRDAVLEYWATRAEGPEGSYVMDTVETWLRQVLWEQMPPTEQELTTWDARRSDGRTLPRP
ncbi:MAG: type II toxin-antitoxin system HicA family toxin [Myxococcales bacterium]|nr:type II toxin-antitoxin system HicA family toxin [Myxococcales bacterium]